MEQCAKRILKDKNRFQLYFRKWEILGIIRYAKQT